MAEVKFDRSPYKVTYYKEGKMHTIRRVPPPKLHDAMPGDTVTITNKKNDDWQEGQTVKVKNITSRQPNVLQVEKEDGKYTFLDYRDVKLNERPPVTAETTEQAERDADPIGSKYLLWP